MQQMAFSREYQEKLATLGTPEILNESWEWDLDAEGYKELLGTQLGQMTLGALTFGGSTFMQELGGMTQEAVSLKLKALGVEEELINLKGMTQGMLVILGQKNIKKLNDFADLSSDELIGGFDEIKGKKIRIDGYLEEFSLSRKEADELIMSAREIAYK